MLSRRFITPLCLVAILFAITVIALDRVTIDRLEKLNQSYNLTLTGAIDQIKLDVQYIERLQAIIQIYEQQKGYKIEIKPLPVN